MSTTLKPNDFKNNPEGAEIYKQYILVLEKKIRNLEKRKAKLDDYKVKQSSGTELNEDQKLAVSHYSEVLVMLETLNDLHKTYVSINNDIAKNLKKQAKKVKVEKDQEQSNNIIEVLKLYYVFSALQVSSIKEEIVNQKNNSFNVTEEEFKLLKNLLQNIFNFSPSTPSIKPLESISKASDHIVSLVSNREKPILNTESTYKSIKTLIDKLLDSGCLDSTNVLKSNENPSKPASAEKTAMPSSVDSDTSSEDNDGMVHIEKPENYPSNINKDPHDSQNVVRVSKSNTNQATSYLKNGNYVHSQDGNKNTHINGAINNKSDTRTLNDLLASFQSGFQFMQDSLIEPERQTYFS